MSYKFSNTALQKRVDALSDVGRYLDVVSEDIKLLEDVLSKLCCPQVRFGQMEWRRCEKSGALRLHYSDKVLLESPVREKLEAWHQLERFVESAHEKITQLISAINIGSSK